MRIRIIGREGYCKSTDVFAEAIDEHIDYYKNWLYEKLQEEGVEHPMLLTRLNLALVLMNMARRRTKYWNDEFDRLGIKEKYPQTCSKYPVLCLNIGSLLDEFERYARLVIRKMNYKGEYDLTAPLGIGMCDTIYKKLCDTELTLKAASFDTDCCTVHYDNNDKIELEFIDQKGYIQRLGSLMEKKSNEVFDLYFEQKGQFPSVSGLRANGFNLLADYAEKWINRHAVDLKTDSRALHDVFNKPTKPVAERFLISGGLLNVTTHLGVIDGHSGFKEFVNPGHYEK